MRLRKLIATGFKSFADPTEFDFDAGVTCIVGPNGCGKSNVIDAIKWALGEQSAKNLRGRGMLDVIFNGTSGRKQASYCEVTLIFDNADRRLPINAEEVQIGRRLYRTGESEYLINKSAARLRDIRDLFFDTGVGRTGYSIIEQGRISQFVDASSRDRRIMFEEAAGISRYKVRIAEAGRKLASVELNLERVRDVVDELERRLRSVKIQAGKARNYQELSARLRGLRTLHARSEWERLSALRQTAVGAQADSAAALEQARTLVEQAGQEARLAAARLEQVGREERAASEQQAGAQAELAQLAGEHRAARRRADELHARLDTILQRLTAARARVAQRTAELADCEQQRNTIAGQINLANQQLAQARLAAEQADQTVRELARSAGEAANKLVDCERQLARAHGDAENHQRTIDQLASQLARHRARAEQLETQISELTARHSELHARQTRIEDQLEQANARLDEAREAQRALDAGRSGITAQLSEARQQKSGLASRQQLLTDLLKRREGLGNGPKALLEAAAKARKAQPDLAAAPAHPLDGVVDVIADLFNADANLALPIEAALGRMAQAVVCRNRALLASAGKTLADLPGRCTLVFLDDLDQHDAPAAGRRAAGPNVSPGPTDHALADQPAAPAQPSRLDAVYEQALASTLANPHLVVHTPHAWRHALLAAARASLREPAIHPGVIGRACELVRCEERYNALKLALLGQTIVVRTIDDALAAMPHWPASTRWVSLKGDVMESGSGVPAWHVGPAERGDASGIIARRAELAQVERDLAAVEEVISQLARAGARLDEQLTENHNQQKQLRQGIYELSAERVELVGQVARCHESVRRLEHERPVLQHEITDLTARSEQAAAARTDALSAAEQRRSERAQIEQTKQALARQADEAAAARDARLAATAELQAQIRELAARQAAAHANTQSLLKQRDEQARQAHAAEQELLDANTQIQHCESAALELISRHAVTACRLDQLRAHAAELAARLAEANTFARDADEALAGQQSVLTTAQQAAHAADIAAHDACLRCENLLARTREELNLDLENPDAALTPRQPGQTWLAWATEQAVIAVLDPALAAEQTAPRMPDGQINWPLVEEQIGDLRIRIERLGTVNLDAIAELADLEERHGFLAGQREDLLNASQQLTTLIEQLNSESRVRFAETFEAIRSNFSAMFRKLFGGGKAELVLEKNPDGSEMDILEAGIEVLAKPPGMETRTLTLLSGGQKAMIAVAILMSIFQSKPSPFCLLDEVDAPLDEANNVRFNSIIREFLAFTQFVIITHSKPTMTIADRLYGVTMQEAGVSKRVGVQFDHHGKPAMLDEALAPAGVA